MISGTVTATFGIRFNNVSTGSEYSTSSAYFDGASANPGAFQNDNFVIKFRVVAMAQRLVRFLSMSFILVITLEVLINRYKEPMQLRIMELQI
jgi:hypothetical protein